MKKHRYFIIAQYYTNRAYNNAEQAKYIMQAYMLNQISYKKALKLITAHLTIVKQSILLVERINQAYRKCTNASVSDIFDYRQDLKDKLQKTPQIKLAIEKWLRQ